MLFPSCFTYYILYGKQFFFKEIILHEFSSCPYGPLKKVTCFNLIITEDLFDMHEKPFEKTKQKQKRLFLYCWNLQMDSGTQNENIQPANV